MVAAARSPGLFYRSFFPRKPIQRQQNQNQKQQQKQEQEPHSIFFLFCLI